ncbi:NADH-quinone oxidoreductase subunit NuoK [Desulfofustis limnaeus]|uniref:NADH-quinone oxidoreductase subunit K n=1 Tax=Desulfofustis limnaeus TaxID=2740163 RepID=A0ABN6MAD4_9BACT|nr:NADH-quinone oxidoreductase subunit NuoK [Desulfofustis limnaeus]MDX9895573.1 NADH-quinone oxidoreductase subunit NuoK [Desulfofustis sp.]BDD89350.1 NADH-quinone oxidoreductase subunit K [Desulfofustis limnaeus]
MIEHYLSLSIVLFCLGVLGVISRRNVFVVFMSIELMLNAANLGFVAVARLHQSMDGHVLALLVMAVAAAEAALALAVVILLHKHKGNLDTNIFSLLKG